MAEVQVPKLDTVTTNNLSESVTSVDIDNNHSTITNNNDNNVSTNLNSSEIEINIANIDSSDAKMTASDNAFADSDNKNVEIEDQDVEIEEQEEDLQRWFLTRGAFITFCPFVVLSLYFSGLVMSNCKLTDESLLAQGLTASDTCQPKPGGFAQPITPDFTFALPKKMNYALFFALKSMMSTWLFGLAMIASYRNWFPKRWVHYFCFFTVYLFFVASAQIKNETPEKINSQWGGTMLLFVAFFVCMAYFFPLTIDSGKNGEGEMTKLKGRDSANMLIWSCIAGIANNVAMTVSKIYVAEFFPKIKRDICLEKAAGNDGPMLGLKEFLGVSGYFSILLPLITKLYAQIWNKGLRVSSSQFSPGYNRVHSHFILWWAQSSMDVLRMSFGRWLLLKSSSSMFYIILGKDIFMAVWNFGIKFCEPYIVFCMRVFHSEAYLDLNPEYRQFIARMRFFVRNANEIPRFLLVAFTIPLNFKDTAKEFDINAVESTVVKKQSSRTSRNSAVIRKTSSLPGSTGNMSEPVSVKFVFANVRLLIQNMPRKVFQPHHDEARKQAILAAANAKESGLTDSTELSIGEQVTKTISNSDLKISKLESLTDKSIISKIDQMTHGYVERRFNRFLDNIGVSESERKALAPLAFAIQGHIFIRFQIRSSIKLAMSIALCLMPYTIIGTDAKYLPGFPLNEAGDGIRHSFIVPCFAFLLFDFWEWFYVTFFIYFRTKERRDGLLQSLKNCFSDPPYNYTFAWAIYLTRFCQIMFECSWEPYTLENLRKATGYNDLEWEHVFTACPQDG